MTANREQQRERLMQLGDAYHNGESPPDLNMYDFFLANGVTVEIPTSDQTDAADLAAVLEEALNHSPTDALVTVGHVEELRDYLRPIIERWAARAVEVPDPTDGRIDALKRRAAACRPYVSGGGPGQCAACGGLRRDHYQPGDVAIGTVAEELRSAFSHAHMQDEESVWLAVARRAIELGATEITVTSRAVVVTEAQIEELTAKFDGGGRLGLNTRQMIREWWDTIIRGAEGR